ncbi:rRNA cytosine-C5-methylase [Acetobacteraceae bacterium H6797]|nr:rRNA cytosine-C5-methylase [Acetobacteraceae bacterium H6797]
MSDQNRPARPRRPQGHAARPAAPHGAGTIHGARPPGGSRGGNGGPAPLVGRNPSRGAALALLQSVLERHRALDEALDSLPHSVAPRDKAAAHRIAGAVLRRLGSLDELLEPFLRREPHPAARMALRIGAAELLLLDTPPHAAVASAVDLVPKPFAGLVNAVLRKVAQEGPAQLEGLDAARLDTPYWLWSSWHKAYGPAVRAMAEAQTALAPLDLSVKPGFAWPEEMPEGIPAPEKLPTGSWRFPPGTRITDLPGFEEGEIWAQDAAAALPALLLKPQAGERIADLCAAPGGKTAQLAAAGARVWAVERDPRRAQRLRENLSRLKLDAAVVEADLTRWSPNEKFDAILLDAPCSATGTIRRHPDVPHLRRQGDVEKLAETQRALLGKAASLLKLGGRMVFATCSLQPEEGEAHMLTAVAAHGLVPDPIRPEELPELEQAVTSQGALRTRPDYWAERGGMDGFFAARFRKERE